MAVHPFTANMYHSVQKDSAGSEDDLTVKLTEIIPVNSLIRTALDSREAVHILMVSKPPYQESES